MKTKRPLADFRIALPVADPVATTVGLPLSPEQQAVIDWVRAGTGSAFVEAVAGSGKTHTLIAACRHMTGTVAFAAFNKKIADEIKYKIGDGHGQRNVRVGTFHSFGFASWRNMAPGVRVDETVKRRMMLDACEVPWPLRPAVAQMVSHGKQSVVGVEWEFADDRMWKVIAEHFDVMFRVEGDRRPEEEIVDDLVYYARRGAEWSRDNGMDVIDFDDMIWLPLVHGCPVHTYDWVLCDEAQDTNAARRLLARRMMKMDSRAIFVGDRRQAIYGFTGADSNAVDLIVGEFGCASLPLTVTFRCSKRATELAQTWVPQITAHEENEDGAVVWASPSCYFSHEPFAARVEYYAEGELAETTMSPLAPGDAILCRVTKPIVSLAFSLIRNGVPAHVEGRDIGKQLDRLASKWHVSSVIDLVAALEEYRRQETDKLVARDARRAIEALNDRIDTLQVLTEDCETVAQVRDKIDRLFRDTNGGRSNTVLLSTIHKAKGREWERVFILGYGEYMPSKWARKEWEHEAERNLFYVAVTRTKRDLILTGAVG